MFLSPPSFLLSSLCFEACDLFVALIACMEPLRAQTRPVPSSLSCSPSLLSFFPLRAFRLCLFSLRLLQACDFLRCSLLRRCLNGIFAALRLRHIAVCRPLSPLFLPVLSCYLLYCVLVLFCHLLSMLFFPSSCLCFVSFAFIVVSSPQSLKFPSLLHGEGK